MLNVESCDNKSKWRSIHFIKSIYALRGIGQLVRDVVSNVWMEAYASLCKKPRQNRWLSRSSRRLGYHRWQAASRSPLKDPWMGTAEQREHVETEVEMLPRQQWPCVCAGGRGHAESHEMSGLALNRSLVGCVRGRAHQTCDSPSQCVCDMDLCILLNTVEIKSSFFPITSSML